MKKILFAAAAALLAGLNVTFSLPAAAAESSEKYAVIAESDVYLYANETLAEEDKLCILPKSYYVQIDSDLGDCYSVYYMDDGEGYGRLFGFVKKDEVTPKVPKTQPYYFSRELEKDGTPKLYTVGVDDPESVMISPRQRIYYYGDMPNANGVLYYYVVVSGKLGYVPAQNIVDFEIPVHPDSIVPPSPSPTITPTPSGDTTVSGEPVTDDNKMQIILIAAICIPAIIIVFLLFKGSGKPPKSRARDSYARINYPPYDKDNFEDDDER